MSLFKVLEISILSLYFLGALFYLMGILRQREGLKKTAAGFTFAGFLLHTTDLFALIAGTGQITLQQGQFYISLLAWTFLLIYLLMSWRLKLPFLALTAAPLALILFSSSLVVSTATLNIPPFLSSLWFGMHILALFLSIALLGLAFGAGFAYLFLEKKIKGKSGLLGWTKQLPSLASFDSVNKMAVSIGFPLYTLGLLAGFAWAKLTWSSMFTWDPKELASISIWFLYAYLFHQRIVIGWRGRKPAKMAIWVFFFTILSLVGINFFLPTHHSFQP